MRQSYYRKYARRWLSVALLPLFCMLAGYVVASNCDKIANGRYRCTDIKGLVNKTVVISEEDISANGIVVFGNAEYCNISYTTDKQDDPSAGGLRDKYDVEVGGNSKGGAFVLRNGLNDIPVTFKWRGGMPMNGGAVWETLGGPDALTGEQQGAFSCADKPYSQAWMRFEVASSDLQSVLPGDYTGSFTVDIGLGSRPYHRDVDFTVRLPPLIRISGLHDMPLKARNANNDRYSQEQSFCVFVSGGGIYWIRASGGRVHNTPFELSNGGDTIDYDVSLSTDGTNLVDVNPGDWVKSENGSPSLNCNGRTNSKVRIVVLDSNVVGKPTGVYDSTLYLTAEPG